MLWGLGLEHVHVMIKVTVTIQATLAEQAPWAAYDHVAVYGYRLCGWLCQSQSV